ncbi:MAG: hypothetical protein QME48_02550 [bacterium]|nr:hypothetical protein [bacterium]
MPGFGGVFSFENNFKTFEVDEVISKNYLKRRKSFENGFLFQNTLNKFLDEKIFEEDEEIFICFEGIFFNHKNLRIENSVNDDFSLLKKLFLNLKNLSHQKFMVTILE